MLLERGCMNYYFFNLRFSWGASTATPGFSMDGICNRNVRLHTGANIDKAYAICKKHEILELICNVDKVFSALLSLILPC